MTKRLMLLTILSALAVAGCGKKAVRPAAVPQQPVVAAAEDKNEPAIRFADWENTPELKTIHFDYDAAELSPASRDALQANAEYLKGHDELNVLVEGHCDERGTTEYNLALGQRRAAAVREYYGVLGVPLARVGTISYGKEKPAVQGSSENAWAQNRRAETKVRSK